MEEQKIVLGLVPRKPSVPEIVAYIDDLVKLLPNLKVIVSLMGRRDEDLTPLINHPAVEGLPLSNRRLNIVAGGYNVMSMARTMEVDWVFFNLGIFRYSAKEVAKFISNALAACQARAQMAYGKPPDICLESASKEDLLALEKLHVSYRLTADSMINYIYSKALDMKQSNVNAGMLGAKMKAIKYLLSVSDYDDSSLLCPQMIWHLKRAEENFEVLPVDIDNVNLGHLGFSIERAVHELLFALTQVGYAGRLTDSATGQWMQVRKIASEFFSEKGGLNRWTSKNEEWFFKNMVPRLEDGLRKYVKKTST